MRRPTRFRGPSPAMAVALIALFVALGGSAWAVATINGSSLKNRSVPGKKLKVGAVKASELANKAVTPAKTAGRPAARVTRDDVSQAIPSGVFTSVAFPTEEFDTANLHSGSTNNERLTAPIAGTYVVTGELGWDNATNAGYRRAELRRESLTLTKAIATEGGFGVLGGVFPRQMVSTVVRLKKGEWVRLTAGQSSGGNLDVRWATLAMAWIGP